MKCITSNDRLPPAPHGPREVRIITDEPLVVGQHYLDNEWSQGNDLALRRYAGEWWVYGDGGYQAIPDDWIRSVLNLWLGDVKVRHVDGQGNVTWKPFRPTKYKVADVLAALASIVQVCAPAPVWLDLRQTPKPANLIAFRNGLLDVDDYCQGEVELLPATPVFFTTTGVRPYDFDLDAECPVFRKYLNEALDRDHESIDLALEWGGYNMVPDRRHEKFMLAFGPPRSGRGTFLAAMETALGKPQVAYTTFADLSGQFGMEPLIGKLAAFMADAHISPRMDVVRGMERIKSVVGADPQPVNRKHKPMLPGDSSPIRFTIAVNELPDLPDTVGALLPRLLLLHFPRSFAGQEDPTLKDRIKAEAPGIAVLFLEGLKRLRERGRFTEPAASKPFIERFRTRVAPVAAFVAECCDVGRDYSVRKDRLRVAFKDFAAERDIVPIAGEDFTKQLFRVCPTVTTGRLQIDQLRERVFKGIKLKKGVKPPEHVAGVAEVAQ
ncbi:MAG: hypothetical protein IH983_04210 [Planctomycetes bacterium]|nr:hypothetical protein [Planctomycetota bacterium]